MKILLIEDDVALTESLSYTLTEAGFTVDVIHEGHDALKRLIVHRDIYDVIILDMLLPEINGEEICKQIREEKINVPVLFLSGVQDITQKVKALNVGADDYMTKPFSSSELIARIHALLRRPTEVETVELSVGNITLNPIARKVFRNGQEVELTLKEFNVLEYLMRFPEQVITRDRILEHVWDFNFSPFSNVVDVHINSIRKKMNLGKNDELESVHGVGYRLKDTSWSIPTMQV